jgi:hypothetical protein
MGNLISAISGQFGKPLILGTLLPVTVALFVLLALVAPQISPNLPFLVPLETLGKEWQALVFSIAAVILSGLLVNLNGAIIRFYEGYPWQKTWIGQRRSDFFKREVDLLEVRRINLLSFLRWLPAEHPLEAAVSGRLGRVVESLKHNYPTTRSSVMPTRLGNGIRSFENYPRDQYGISAIPVWPRLIAVIPKEYAAALDDEKTTFDFLINSSLLTGIMALVVISLGALDFSRGQAWGNQALWLVEACSLAALCRFFYRQAIPQAVTWGELVRGAFDLYRWDLLAKMGYQQKPETREEERRLWRAISTQLLFGDDDDSGPWIKAYTDFVLPTDVSVDSIGRSDPAVGDEGGER